VNANNLVNENENVSVNLIVIVSANGNENGGIAENGWADEKHQ
jgi:hypothetical protein